MCESGCEGEEGDKEEDREGKLWAWGVSDSGVAAGMMTTCKVRTRVLRDMTFNSKVAIVLYAAACCACNELNSSTADSS
jgi:hypothetical protein